MAIIISDDFNRANDPTSLGTAPTGQVWTQEGGVSGSWGINTNSALWTWNSGNTQSRSLIDSGFTDGYTEVKLLNPNDTASSFGIGAGIVIRYVNASYFWRLVYFYNGLSLSQVVLQRTYAGLTVSVFDSPFGVLSNGDTIGVSYCGDLWEMFINGVSQGTYDASAHTQNYGTICGLIATSGTYFSTILRRFDDFLVTTTGTCTPTYNCVAGACVDPGDGTGTYATLAACLDGCVVAASYNCVAGQCVDPGDGSGTYATLAECVASGCGGGTVVVETVRFDSGTGSGYYYVAPVVDSDDELRSKTVKAVRVTGKLTNAASEVYGYDVSDVVNVSNLEQGLNSTTGQLPITDTTGVAQTPREQVNVPNAVLHTVRVLGDDTGETTRDRIDEIVTEQSDIGVRR